MPSDVEHDRDALFANGSTFAPAHRDQVVGIESVLEQIDTMIHWLKHSTEFTAHKSRMEPGLLLEGRPGTGKTLCSRYIATESKALFVSIRDWPLTGDFFTPADITDFFSRARRHYRDTGQPVVLFWDEFETYAQDRGMGHITPRQASLVSQLTAEMDGVNGKCEGILFVGCTNYKDNIDPALLRPGRMGVHIHFTSPDRNGKTVLLKHYLAQFCVAPDIDYDAASFFFEEDATAAEIEESVQMVWLHAVMQSLQVQTEPLITNALIHQTLLRRLLGSAPAHMELRPDTELRVAVHELGHAIVAKSLGVPLRIITIQPGDLHFGRTFTHQPYDKVQTVDDLFSSICISLGSVCAETEVGMSLSAGVRNDTLSASHTALGLANAHGTDDIGLLNFDAFDVRNRVTISPMSDHLKTLYDGRGLEVMRNARRRATQIIHSVGKERILTAARWLVEETTWTGPQFDRVWDELLSVSEYDSDRPLRLVGHQGFDHPTLPLD